MLKITSPNLRHSFSTSFCWYPEVFNFNVIKYVLILLCVLCFFGLMTALTLSRYNLSRHKLCNKICHLKVYNLMSFNICLQPCNHHHDTHTHTKKHFHLFYGIKTTVCLCRISHLLPPALGNHWSAFCRWAFVILPFHMHGITRCIALSVLLQSLDLKLWVASTLLHRLIVHSFYC